MECKEFSNLLDAYMDGALPDADARRMEKHEASCASCAALLALRRDCRGLEEEIEVPEAFSSAWRTRIREEVSMEEKKRKVFNWKGWVAAAAALVFVVGGTLMSRDQMPSRSSDRNANAVSTQAEESAYGAGSLSARKSASYENGADLYVMEDMAYEMDYDADEAAESESTREKIIRSASFTVKTAAYDTDLESIRQLTQDMGGRIEYLSSWGDASSGQIRSASLTLRIPAARLDDFLDGAQGIGQVTAMTQSMEDVSDTYYDIQTRLETQREKMKRLQSMIQAAEDVSDLIEIESAIADTQYYIDRYTGQLKSYDSRVDYSTVQVRVQEIRVTEVENVSLGQRIVNGLQDSLVAFGEFLEDMVLFIVCALPWLAVIGAAAAAGIMIVKKRKKSPKTKIESKKTEGKETEQ